MKSVLFLCPDNAIRSPMAEALLRRESGERFHVMSAGLRPTEIHPLAVRVMAEIGIDVSGHRPTGIKGLLGRVPASYAIFVCEATEPHCPKLYPDALATLRWALPDPRGASNDELNAFREARDQLDERIRDWSQAQVID